MSFNTDWDIEKYKSEFESEEQWKLRKEFMLAHKDKFPEERLVCLAQVFFNVEFLGCKYPEKTMKLVEELSKDVAAEHREQQKTKLQRTFVKASDAAGAKVKGLKRGAESVTSSQPNERNKRWEAEEMGCQRLSNITESRQHQFTCDTLGNKYEMSWTSEACSDRTRFANQSYNSNSHFVNSKSKGDILMDEIRRTRGPCGNLVIFLRVGEHPNCTLSRTAGQWSKSCQTKLVKEDGSWHASVTLDNVELSNCVYGCKTTARKMAGQLALDKLMQSYYTVKIKVPFSGGNKEVVQTAGRKRGHEENDNSDLRNKNEDALPSSDLQSQEDKAIGGSQQMSLPSSSCKDDSVTSAAGGKDYKMEAVDADVPLDDDNVGLKLLKMMGWSGGGLGKNQQGIAEPIKATGLAKSRAGLGSVMKVIEPRHKRGKKNGASGAGEDLSAIKRLIKEYRYNNDLNDLVFSSDFTKEQRVALHKYAQSIGLKSKSYGGKKEENRHLVLSKRIDNWTIIEGLVKNVDEFFHKYELLRPGEQKAPDDVL